MGTVGTANDGISGSGKENKKVKLVKEPMVSVIIPAYNCANFIGKAIESVLEQKVKTQIIVINDRSNDMLDQRINNYKNRNDFIYIKNSKNLGVAETRNLGVRIAAGKYIAFLDADDWWEPDKLEKQLEIMEKENCILSCTGRQLVDKYGKKTGKVIHVKEKIRYEELLRHNSIACSSVLLLRDVALKYPMKFSEVHEDYLTWLQILEKYRQVRGIDEPLLLYRLSEKGKSRNKLKSAKMTYGVYRKLGKGKGSSFMLTASHLAHGILKYWS